MTTFDIAQALRRSHCDRKGSEHDCVGEVTIKRGEICLDCKLCGKGSEIPDWHGSIATALELVFEAAGISWQSLSIDAKLAAIKRARNHFVTGV